MNEHIKLRFKNQLVGHYITIASKNMTPITKNSVMVELDKHTLDINNLSDSELLDQVILFCNEGHIVSEYGIQALTMQNRSLAENNPKNMLKFDLVKNYSIIFGYDTTIELINTFLDCGE